MTVAINKEAVALRAKLAALKARVANRQTTVAFTGDSTTTTFTLGFGWRVKTVYAGGLRKQFGSGTTTP